MRFNLDVPVEKRRLEGAGRHPPGSGISSAIESRAKRRPIGRRGRAGVLASLKPGRVPGPVRLTLIYEERAGRRDLDHLIRPVVELCVRHALIDSDHRGTLREVRAGWGAVRGLRWSSNPCQRQLRAMTAALDHHPRHRRRRWRRVSA